MTNEIISEEVNRGPAPLVSVGVTVYNGADFLPRALDSALGQRTEFPLEIVVGNDASTDGTAEVLRHYQQRYPDIVRPLNHPRNVGMQRNYYETYEHCRGKYIARLDADDYWTDPEKLAIQARVMDEDPTVALVAHAVRWVRSDGTVEKERYPSIAAGRYRVDELLRHNFPPSPAVMFRNGAHRALPEWYFDAAPLTDWPLYLVAAFTGDIVLLERNMADYTLNEGSALWGQGDLFWYELDARFYDLVDGLLSPELRRLARLEKSKRYENVAYYRRQRGDFVGSRQAAVKAVLAPGLFDRVPGKLKTLAAAVVREAEWRLQGKKVLT